MYASKIVKVYDKLCRRLVFGLISESLVDAVVWKLTEMVDLIWIRTTRSNRAGAGDLLKKNSEGMAAGNAAKRPCKPLTDPRYGLCVKAGGKGRGFLLHEGKTKASKMTNMGGIWMSGLSLESGVRSRESVMEGMFV